MYVHFAGSCAQFPIFRSEKSVIEFIVIVVAGCWQVFEYQWTYTIFVEETLKKEERKKMYELLADWCNAQRKLFQTPRSIR